MNNNKYKVLGPGGERLMKVPKWWDKIVPDTEFKMFGCWWRLTKLSATSIACDFIGFVGEKRAPNPAKLEQETITPRT